MKQAFKTLMTFMAILFCGVAFADSASAWITAAETFDGYVVGADGMVAGTVQVKAAKPNKKTGVSKLTAAVTMLGEKKLSIKGETIDGSATMTAKDGRVLAINLDSDVMSGTFEGKNIVIARNIFTAKDEVSKSTASSVLAKAQGVYVAALLSEDGVGAFTVEVKAKGKVKVSGSLADGTKVSASSQLIANADGSSMVPIVYTKKSVTIAMVVSIASDGTVSASAYDTSKYTEVKIARHSASASDSSLAFSIDAGAVAESFAGVAEINTAILPDCIEVTQRNGKWTLPKAGKVKYKNEYWDISGDNPSALKLSYKSKTGAFTGSFNVYGLVNGKMKKYSVKISGVVVDGIGYGTASLKKPAASWAVRIESGQVSKGNLTGANAFFQEGLKNGEGEKYSVSVGISNTSDLMPNLKLNRGTLVVSGLPNGLTYDTKTGKITGIATKAGIYTVTLTVTDGKAKYVSTITVEVEALPDWVVGTFEGCGFDDPDFDGSRNVWTISCQGKVVNKYWCSDGNGLISEVDSMQLTRFDGDSFVIDHAYTASDRWGDYRGGGTYIISRCEVDGVVFGVIEGEYWGEEIESDGNYGECTG